jgi:PAS domain S-box-containing protein
MRKITALIVEAGYHNWELLRSVLRSFDIGEIRHAEDKKTAVRYYKERSPDILMICLSPEEGNWINWIGRIKERDSGCQVVLIRPENNREPYPEDIRRIAAGILTQPLLTDDVDILLRNSIRYLAVCEKLEKRKVKARKIRKSYTRLIDTERFVAVRQIVENMSSFIGSIANDVQGGIRYFNEMPYFVSIHNRDLKVVAANSSYKKHFGNLVNDSSWKIYRGKAASPPECPVGKTIETGSIQRINAEVEYRSGSRIPVIVHTSPIFNNDGEIELVLEVSAGVKEVVSLKQELQKTQQRYQQLFDEVPSFIAVLDRQLRITAINRPFKEQFGEVTGNPFFDVLRQRDYPVSYCPINQTLEDGKPHQSEMVFARPAGGHFRAMIWTSPILTSAKKLLQILVIFIDITHLRNMQDNLSSLGLMLSSISHGIKGVLTGLDAGLYLIDSGFYKNRPGKIEEGLDVTRLMTERIKKIVHDILYYSKERPLQLETSDLYSFSFDVISAIEKRIKSANIDFVTEVDFNDTMISIDKGVLRSALINILENAMEACIEDPSGKKFTIVFKVYREDDDAIFEIIDNGPGIEKESLSTIFTIFFSTKGNKGTGLGLYIADKVVRQHGGSIEVFSRLNDETRFVVRIPCAREVSSQDLLSASL